jgi:hypothetical protein
MTKGNRILGKLAVLGLSVVMMASCGGGSGSGKKLASNEFLGDLPNLVYQYHFADSLIKAERKAERAKLNSKSDAAKWDKIKEKLDAREKEEKEKLKVAIGKIKPTLIGKDIPFEVEEGAGYKISSCKISDLYETGDAKIEFYVEITDVSKAIPSRYTTKFIGGMENIDRNGNKIGTNGSFNVEMSSRENGVTAKGETSIHHISAQHVDFAKIKFKKP